MQVLVLALLAAGGAADDLAFETLAREATLREGVPRWKTGPVVREGALGGLQGPRILHRSHNYSATTLSSGDTTADARLRMVARNVVSCAEHNPGFETRWYDDRRLEAVLDAFGAADERLEAAVAALRRPPFSAAFVARADLARLAMLYLYGGFWLDSDAACIDAIETSLPPVQGCVFAWEGSVADSPSAPLNWAMGCPRPGHGFVLDAALLVAERIQHYLARGPGTACAGERGAYCATGDGRAMIPVLSITGPAALGDALAAYAGVPSNRALREAHGEDPRDQATWATVSYVESSRGDVTVLPYCFFRSRGCAHLKDAFDDRVIFHHEFDTAWRRSFWHNYLPAAKPETLRSDL